VLCGRICGGLDGEGEREETSKQDFPHPVVARNITDGSKGREQVRKHAHDLKMIFHTTLCLRILCLSECRD